MRKDDSLSLNDKINKLVKFVEEEGIVAVTRREDLDGVDQSLLEMLATLQGADEALAILEERRIVSAPSSTKRYTIR